MAELSGSKFIERGAHKGKGIAVFTSGGDSQVKNFNSCLYIFLNCNFLGDECSCQGCGTNGHLFGMQSLFY